jgi:hypothetical protein
MIVCPVCEHAQPHGADCEVCGKRLGPPSSADPPVPPVEGLEPTLQAPADVAGDTVPELEPTRHAATTAADELTPDLEPTATAPVDVDVATTPDLERTSARIPGDARTALPAIAVCRYCRTPAVPGERICARCGMRLPVPGASAAEAAPDEDSWRCSCGTLARGSLCPTCGARRAAH